MTVILGVAGYVELRRSTTADIFSSIVNPSDVNAAKNRFSFDFPSGMLLTGDRIEIKATDGGVLSFIEITGWNVGVQLDRGTWYVNIDELGGVRLYDTFSNALNGETPGRVDLIAPERNIPIEVKDVAANARILGRVTSYEFNNSREAVDVTELSDEFRRQHSSLISGSGSIQCFFDYRNTAAASNGQPPELAVYMHQLLLRQKLGGEFSAKLFVLGAGWGTAGAAAEDDRLWFEFDAIITNAGVALQPDAAVQSKFDFVTTGPISFKAVTSPAGNYILQEDADYLLLDQDPSSRLELEYDD
jgi:hypothetical protein